MNYKTFYENTILDSINFEDYEVKPTSDLDKVKEVYNIFLKEFILRNNKHLNEIYLFSEWLRGLPNVLSVPYCKDKILQNALLVGIDVKDEDKFLDRYWSNLSLAFYTLKDNL